VYTLEDVSRRWEPACTVWLKPTGVAPKKGGLRVASFCQVTASTGDLFVAGRKVVVKASQDHVLRAFRDIYLEEAEFHLVKRVS
jgi:hypothetical protein